MTNTHLATYLNDHLAGSSATLELLDTLASMPGLADFARHLRDEIAQDRQQLESLMERLEIPQSTFRRAAGWVTEKLAEFKMRVDDPSTGALRRLEFLEALALGIDGKKALWRLLNAIASRNPALETLDYHKLLARATEQRQEVEERRLQAASAAFAA